MLSFFKFREFTLKIIKLISHKDAKISEHATSSISEIYFNHELEETQRCKSLVDLFTNSQGAVNS